MLSLREYDRFGLDDAKKRTLLLNQMRGVEMSRCLRDISLMGMDYDFRRDEFFMSYYAGADWIDERHTEAMVVRPKIEGLDFQTMFMKCFACEKVNKDLDKLFFIRTEDKPIEVDTKDFQLEPLLLVYFMNVVKRIVKKGLKSGYLIQEERLKSRIKGKVLVGRYLKHGFAQGRKDEVDCRFHEFGIDCLENRILKAALVYCREMMTRQSLALGIHLQPLLNMYNDCMSAFINVSSGVSPQELSRVHLNPMFKDYREAMPLARMIIRKQGKCVGDIDGGIQKFPPFIIDMPVLFERYVYALLAERYESSLLGYQESVCGSMIDFSKKDEQMLIDTKYILHWDDEVIHDRLRQLSGYVRHNRIRSSFLDCDDDSSPCPCMVIYPSKTGVEGFNAFPDRWLSDQGDPAAGEISMIPEYHEFYKLAVKLPVVHFRTFTD